MTRPMPNDNPEFKAFNDFGVDDIRPQASISRRMLRRLEDIDNATSPGPSTREGRVALASSVVAHAVVELEAELTALKRQLASEQH